MHQTISQNSYHPASPPPLYSSHSNLPLQDGRAVILFRLKVCNLDKSLHNTLSFIISIANATSFQLQTIWFCPLVSFFFVIAVNRGVEQTGSVWRCILSISNTWRKFRGREEGCWWLVCGCHPRCDGTGCFRFDCLISFDDDDDDEGWLNGGWILPKDDGVEC